MSLPDDLARDILLMLPTIKSVVRLSCVCKSWHDLTRDPGFRNEFSNNIKNHRFNKEEDDDSSSLVFLIQKVKTSGNPNYEYSLLSKSPESCHNAMPCLVNSPQLEVVGSCNGIFCFAETGFPLLLVHLYNPITREHRKLPPGAHRSEGGYRMLGFGFDSSTNDYKVVNIFGKHNVKIYKLSTNSWTRVYVDFGSDFTLTKNNTSTGVLVNGYFHWLFENKEIITFDFKTERFGKIVNLPLKTDKRFGEKIEFRSGSYDTHQSEFSRSAINNLMNLHLAKLDDSLALCVCNYYNRCETSVWVVKEYGNKRFWTMKFLVNVFLRDLVTCWIHDANLLMLMCDGSLTKCSPDEAKTKLSRLDCAYVSGTVFQPSFVSFRP